MSRSLLSATQKALQTSSITQESDPSQFSHYQSTSTDLNRKGNHIANKHSYVSGHSFGTQSNQTQSNTVLDSSIEIIKGKPNTRMITNSCR